MKRYTLLTADMDGTVLNTRKGDHPRTAGRPWPGGRLGSPLRHRPLPGRVRPYLADFPDMRYLLCHSGATVTDLRTGAGPLLPSPSTPPPWKGPGRHRRRRRRGSLLLGNELYIEALPGPDALSLGCQVHSGPLQRAHWVPDRDALLAEHIHDVRKLNFFFATTPSGTRCGEIFRTMPPGVRLRHPQ